MKYAMSCLLACLLAACATPPGGSPAPEVVALDPGEQREVQSLRVRFLGVEDDSRCPPRATCIREGEARVLLQVSSRGETARLAPLTSPRDSTRAAFGAYLLRIDSLSPRPEPGSSVYRLWLEVARTP